MSRSDEEDFRMRVSQEANKIRDRLQNPTYVICKICGTELLQVRDEPPEYCNQCNPRYPKVTVQVLDQLPCVPSAYRKMVELDILHGFRCCGDVSFLYADDLFGARQHLEGQVKVFDLQPFAQTAGGEFWCWTSLRTGLLQEPEILEFDESTKFVHLYAPNFPTFLYRTALEDASGQWQIKPDELPSDIASMGKVLRKVGAAELGDDLEALSLRPVLDYTPESYRSHGLQLRGLLSQEEVQNRIRQFLGKEFLAERQTYEAFRKG